MLCAMVATPSIIEADLEDPSHARAVVALLDGYARSDFGQARPLSESVKAKLIDQLKLHPTTRIFLARRDDDFVGIATCFVGFSTFAARPLLNIHDIYVREDQQGQGLGRRLLEAVEQAAVASDCCKITLEVMDANTKALELYKRFGFKLGQAGDDAHRFMNKPL